MRFLKDDIERIRKNSPQKLKGHQLVHLYTSLVDVMADVMRDPTQDKYLLGKTMGKKHRDWRRAKRGRYRLFFKFFSKTHELFFVWLNNEKTLRKAGDKTDCYAVFRRMLDSGVVPSKREALIADSVKQKEN